MLEGKASSLASWSARQSHPLPFAESECSGAAMARMVDPPHVRSRTIIPHGIGPCLLCACRHYATAVPSAAARPIIRVDESIFEQRRNLAECVHPRRQRFRASRAAIFPATHGGCPHWGVCMGIRMECLRRRGWLAPVPADDLRRTDMVVKNVPVCLISSSAVLSLVLSAGC
jgi:hypothetical protein